MLDILCKISEVYFRLLGAIGFHVKAKNERFTAASWRYRQNLKYENLSSSFGRQTFAQKSVLHVQLDYFSSFNQSNHWSRCRRHFSNLVEGTTSKWVGAICVTINAVLFAINLGIVLVWILVCNIFVSTNIVLKYKYVLRFSPITLRKWLFWSGCHSIICFFYGLILIVEYFYFHLETDSEEEEEEA